MTALHGAAQPLASGCPGDGWARWRAAPRDGAGENRTDLGYEGDTSQQTFSGALGWKGLLGFLPCWAPPGSPAESVVQTTVVQQPQVRAQTPTPLWHHRLF